MENILVFKCVFKNFFNIHTNKLQKYFAQNDSYIIDGRNIDELIKDLYFNDEDITMNLKILIFYIKIKI